VPPDTPVLGTRENPYELAPKEWGTSGVPYGAYCRCRVCGQVARSTLAFDYYARKPGEPLVCETCTLGTPLEVAKALDEVIEPEDPRHA
jgi:hypothetical protein